MTLTECDFIKRDDRKMEAYRPPGIPLLLLGVGLAGLGGLSGISAITYLGGLAIGYWWGRP